MNSQSFPEIDAITDQVGRYSPEHARHWHTAIAVWDDARKSAFCEAVRAVKGSSLMSGRVAKIIGGYTDGPVTGTPVLVFGEVPPGGGAFKPGTNQLIFSLSGTEYWKYPFNTGMTKRVPI